MKVIVYGAQGTMGKVLQEHLSELAIDYVGVDPHSNTNIIHRTLDTVSGDVLIDFSHHSHTETIITYALLKKIPLIIATTGHDESQEQQFQTAAQKIAVFKSANLSFSINLLARILKDYTRLLEETYDIEITEKHHKHKVDAPSGTAYLLAEAIQSGSATKKTIITDRSGTNQKRAKHDIGISALRGGTIVGEHAVSFNGDADILEFTHKAQSKRLFTEGAIKAAQYILNQAPGLYTMDDLITESREHNA